MEINELEFHDNCNSLNSKPVDIVQQNSIKSFQILIFQSEEYNYLKLLMFFNYHRP